MTTVEAKLPIEMTRAEYKAICERLFGPDVMKWRFVCPVCEHVASVADYQAAGAPEHAIAFSCVGRFLPEKRDAFGGKGSGPCDYTGGGLLLSPVRIGDDLFFAPDGWKPEEGAA